jgi:hypothetical protein
MNKNNFIKLQEFNFNDYDDYKVERFINKYNYLYATKEVIKEKYVCNNNFNGLLVYYCDKEKSINK